MTIYTPELKAKVPVYRALADAIQKDIEESKLVPGDQLPTHRELAELLGVTVGTITRGYAEAERRGLTSAVVGRGTFIRDHAEDPWPQHSANPGVIDFTLSLPMTLPEEGQYLRHSIQRILRNTNSGRLLQYESETASKDQKQVAADWLSGMGLSPQPENILVTCGSQHSLNVVFSSLFETGQVVLTTALTYPSLKPIAKTYGVKLRSVGMDEEGMCPDALIHACRLEPAPHGLYLDPTIQNPTTSVMSEKRRQKIAEIAQRFQLVMVEDDVHGFLPETPHLPVSHWLPDQSVYLASVAKCLVPGLRTGYILAPKVMGPRLLMGIHNSVWMQAPLMVEVTTDWLRSDVAETIIRKKRQVIQERQEKASKYFEGFSFRSHPHGYQIWLDLPEAWTTEAFVLEALQRGVKLIGASAFAVNHQNIPRAVRVSLGVPGSGKLDQGLSIIQDMLHSPGPSIY